MKTALQTAIENTKLKIADLDLKGSFVKSDVNPDYWDKAKFREQTKALQEQLLMLASLLPMEREQIEKAYFTGNVDGEVFKPKKSASDYFNETFKPE